MIHDFHIPFDPVPWAAPKLARYGHAYDIREKDKRAVRYLLKEQYKGDPITNKVRLSFWFNFTPPKSATKAVRVEMLAGRIIPTKCDVTNLVKLYEDCLKGIVIDDDRHVYALEAEKCYKDVAGVKIRVATWN